MADDDRSEILTQGVSDAPVAATADDIVETTPDDTLEATPDVARAASGGPVVEDVEGQDLEGSAGDGSNASDEPPAEEADEPVEEPRRPHRRFDLLADTEAALAAAREAIANGECIVLPTDTVYGIGADAFSAQAVQRLLDAKGRGRDMPPPVLIAEPAMLDALGSDVSTFARRLAERFWPGALTLVVSMQSSLRIDLGDTDGTIALRVPAHEAARTLLRRTGPLAVSSANVSGQPSATSIDDAIAQLGDSVSVYLDAGPTPGPIPSTIVEFVSDPAGVILREGVLDYETISDVAPLVARLVADHSDEAAAPADDAATDETPADAAEPAGETSPDATPPGETSPDATASAVEASSGAGEPADDVSHDDVRAAPRGDVGPDDPDAGGGDPDLRSAGAAADDPERSAPGA